MENTLLLWITIKETEALEINKYSYANYEKVGTILSSADFKPDGKKAIHLMTTNSVQMKQNSY